MDLSPLLTMNFIKVSLYIFLGWPNTHIVAYNMSNCRDPCNFAPHERESSIPYFGGISTTTVSINILLPGYWTSVTHKSLIKPKHLTLLESKENKSFYGLVISRFRVSMMDFGIKLWEAPESSIVLCRIWSWMVKMI